MYIRNAVISRQRIGDFLEVKEELCPCWANGSVLG